MQRARAIVFFLTIGVQSLAYIFALVQDGKSARASIAIPEVFPAKEQLRDNGPRTSACSFSFVGLARKIFSGPPFSLLMQNAKWRQGAVAQTSDCIAAARLGVDRKTFRTLLTYEEALYGGTLDDCLKIDGLPQVQVAAFYRRVGERISGRAGVIPPNFVADSAHFAATFVTGDDMKAIDVFLALHPARQTFSRSLHHHYGARVATQLMAMNCGLFAGCLFFHQQGAVAYSSDDDCRLPQPLGQVINQLFVMSITAMAAEGPSQALMRLDHNATFKNGTWRHCLVEGLRAAILNFCSIGFNVFYLFTVASFVANVKEEDVQFWLLTNLLTAVGLVVFLKPLLWSLGAILLAVVHRMLGRLFNSQSSEVLPLAVLDSADLTAVLPADTPAGSGGPVQAASAHQGPALDPLRGQSQSGRSSPSSLQGQQPATAGPAVSAASSTSTQPSTGGAAVPSFDHLLDELTGEGTPSKKAGQRSDYHGPSMEIKILPGALPDDAVSRGAEIDELLADLEGGDGSRTHK